MDMDLEPKTLIITGAFWLLILGLIWYVPYGFNAIRDKIILSVFSLPCTYLMIVMQLNR